MNLYQSLFAFSKKNIDHLNENYTWQVSLDHLPIQLNLIAQNVYQQNIELRHKLHQAYLATTIFDEKYKIIEWYIYHWGGVKANSKDTLRKYTETSLEQLIIKGSKGIASWSKALTVIDPAKYFPPLKGRNTLINFFQIKIQPTLSQWDKFDDQEFYSYYLDMLNIVAHELGGKTTHHDIECYFFRMLKN